MENFDCQIEVAQVVSYINSLFDNVNEHFYNQGVQIQLEYSEVALLDMIQKCELTFENNKKLGGDVKLYITSTIFDVDKKL